MEKCKAKGVDDAVKAGKLLRIVDPVGDENAPPPSEKSPAGCHAACLRPLATLLEDERRPSREDILDALSSAAKKFDDLDPTRQVLARGELLGQLEQLKVSDAKALLSASLAEFGAVAKKGPTPFARLMELFDSRPEDKFFASIEANPQPYWGQADGRATPLRSTDMKDHIQLTYYRATGDGLSDDVINRFISVKSAEVRKDGPWCPVFRRSGSHEGYDYLDLCDGGNVVEISPDGQRRTVAAPTGIYFLRKGNAAERLPEPLEVGKGDVLALRELVNASEDQIKTMVGFMTWILCPPADKPSPIALLEGPAGSAKTTTSRLMKYMLDPCPFSGLTKPMPESVRDAGSMLNENHITALDNLDKFPKKWSNFFCIVATGGSLSQRRLYSDGDEYTINLRKPVILSGIDGVIEEPDLASRILRLVLDPISEDTRRSEEDVWDKAEALRPKILTGIIDAYCAAKRHLSDVCIKMPRLADFFRFTHAAEKGLPWAQGDILQAYQEAHAMLMSDTLDQDRVALAFVEYFDGRTLPSEGWQGTASSLLALLRPEDADDKWPSKASTLSARLTKADPLLKSRGYEIRRAHDGKQRTLNIKRLTALTATNGPVSDAVSAKNGVSTGPANGTNGTNGDFALFFRVEEKNREIGSPPRVRPVSSERVRATYE